MERVLLLDNDYEIRHYATGWKVAGLRPDEVNDFNQFT
jgi:hypothetical protein